MDKLKDCSTVDEASDREKRWPRAWKIALIEEMNPEWRDLCETLSK